LQSKTMRKGSSKKVNIEIHIGKNSAEFNRLSEGTRSKAANEDYS